MKETWDFAKIGVVLYALGLFVNFLHLVQWHVLSVDLVKPAAMEGGRTGEDIDVTARVDSKVITGIRENCHGDKTNYRCTIRLCDKI